jgi:hypothetical protein
MKKEHSIIDEELILDSNGAGRVMYPPIKKNSVVMDKPVSVKFLTGELYSVKIKEEIYVEEKDLVWSNVNKPEKVAEFVKPRKLRSNI